MWKLLVYSILLGALLAWVTPAHGESLVFGFDQITNNGPSIGSPQFFVEVIEVTEDDHEDDEDDHDDEDDDEDDHEDDDEDDDDEEANQVEFLFTNSRSDTSAIASIYFDDGTLLGIASIDNDPFGTNVDVEFERGAKPSNLPGGNLLSPPFETTAGFLSGADNPKPKHGVNAGEAVGIIFNLIDGQTFSDVISALELQGQAGGLRIGIHVISFAAGNSESFVNQPQPIPEPSSLALLGIGAFSLFGARFYRRRRQTCR